uniref:Protein with signal anchor n=1 Tax=Anopheles christyi TaxID=43041 RepID=A0A182JTX7_9DIPT
MESMTISAIPPPEPVWCLDRRDSGHLFWRRESSKVKFRYDVEVLEFTKDPYEDQLLITDSELNRAKQQQQQQQQAGVVSNMIVVCVTCVAAIAVTVVLPWFLIGSA